MRRSLGSLVLTLLCSTCLSQVPAVQFSARQDIQTNFQHLTGLAVADFNGDGKPDIAVTDDYTQTLVVYLNDGTGKYSSAVKTTLNVSDINGLGALVAGDVNEDGKQDLIVGPVAGNQVDIVLLGNGDGTFTQGEFIPGSYGFFHAQLVDLNGDKHLDFVSGGNGFVYAAMGDGKGNFTQLSASVPPNFTDFYPDLSVGDFNEDKLLDFVTIGYQTNDLLFFAGTSGGNFVAPTVTQPQYVYSPHSTTAADFNKDGKLDLIIGSANAAILLNGNGDGTFQTGLFLPIAQSANISYNLTPPAVASADLNADGNVDVVVADDTTNMLSVLLNDGTGTFPQSQPDFTAALDPGVGELRLVDINGDGLPDVILTNYMTQNISVFLSVFPKATPTLRLESSSAQALVGSSLTVTVQATGSATHLPTGTVTLTSGSNSLGQQTLDASGMATFTLSNLPVGQYPITAAYSGDTFNTATTNTTSLTESITDFGVTLTSASESVAVGASATYSVVLTPLSGFNGQVAFTCSGLPAGYNCTSASASVTGQSATIPLVVTPPSTTAAVLGAGPVESHSRVFLAFLGFSVFCLGARKRPRMTALVAACLLLCSGVLSGCSGGGSAKPQPYTGTANFTITATTSQGSVSVSHQTTATLTVTR